MNELIKINTNDDGQQWVDARTLWENLQSQQRFSDWINNRIGKYGFVEGKDYFISLCDRYNPDGSTGGGRPRSDYRLSLSMAKELAMFENNEKGREVRLYLIKVEEAWNTPDMIMARALQVARHNMQVYQSKVNTLQLVVAEQKPKVEAFDTFMCGKNSQLVGVVAKTFGVGRNLFFQMLRDAGILDENNVPLQDYMQYFEVILKPIKIRDEIVNKPVTLINPRGVSYLAKRFKFAVSA